jgi:membrane protein implicated in regulation of membrane protease activity
VSAASPSAPDSGRRPRFRGGLVGAGAAACAVCCAAPVLTLLGIGLTGAAATAFTVVFAGLVFGIVVAVATVAAVVVRRRRRKGSRCADDGSSSAAGPVPIQLLNARPE